MRTQYTHSLGVINPGRCCRIMTRWVGFEHLRSPTRTTMHFNALTAALALVFVVSASATALGGKVALQRRNSAGLTCDNWGIVPNTATLSAQCEQENGSFKGTTIPISNCVGNDNGNLACQGG